MPHVPEYLSDRHPKLAAILFGLAMGIIFGAGIGWAAALGWTGSAAFGLFIAVTGAVFMYRGVERHEEPLTNPTWTKVLHGVQTAAVIVILFSDSQRLEIASLMVVVLSGAVLLGRAFLEARKERRGLEGLASKA